MTKTQIAALDLISTHGGLIKTYNNEKGEDYYALVSSTKTINKRIVKSLFNFKKLVPVGDGLFGDSQTYKALEV
jgi:hypothetical protein